MRLLVIDTSGPECAAGVYDTERGDVVSFRSETIGKGHAEILPGMIEATMAESGLAFADLERIAVTIGPGSFTGIRVGVALARGLGLALQIPVVGVTTLEVVAEGRLAARDKPVFAAIDARRDELYGQLFDTDGTAITEASAYHYDELRALAHAKGAAVEGSGAAVLAGAPSPQLDAFPLATIGRIAARLPKSRKAQPLYIRGADARPQTGFAVPHA
ncbi:tRNA (adenosine(37)-N6)-threonylcarbamoyltransferase complex dimerization subunit type 1 TsaB [Rhizobium sp. KVB221]|uniref:tRNA (Adenosine(37)-N6)-threonylcarbamoyltransferase complex dimerization subunit type 1 TsaB n=1 Tax=Rhizobium setariae TaxID=2801340 RepID=A0A936YR27_9HYPH|nr:tRNA (adenosine(37)-N6)-threonylcarbamoyltransferase complex dimerization subunit type 1 TsaB [Rhizobium setariae]MBL0372664.1 tRNA (adenosine(37)-N6)-threonylcarbamoyltransferase complex dimerization subunit type 1 TsaB [Rhizobium setariae]